MPDVLLLVASALVLGALHSFAPDHLAAVSVFASHRPSWRRALGLGARWGTGHSLTVLLVGGALVLSGLHLPARLAPVVERVVGVTLVGLGAFALLRARRIHGHWHDHDGRRHWHLHSHRHSAAHDHGHGALLGIGMLHGLGGTGTLVIALPVTVAASRAHSLLYLAAFGVGTVVSMSLFGAAAGYAFGAAARTSAGLMRAAASGAALASVAVGAWWIVAGGG